MPLKPSRKAPWRKSGILRHRRSETIKRQDYILTPGRYVGIEEQEDDGEPFKKKWPV